MKYKSSSHVLGLRVALAFLLVCFLSSSLFSSRDVMASDVPVQSYQNDGATPGSGPDERQTEPSRDRSILVASATCCLPGYLFCGPSYFPIAALAVALEHIWVNRN